MIVETKSPLGGRFAMTIAGIYALVAPWIAAQPDRTAFWVLILNRLNRMVVRLDRLAIRFNAGTLPAPRPPLATSRPDSECPDSECPDSIRPDSMRPDSMRPDSVRPDSVRPDSVLPDSVRPARPRPDLPRLSRANAWLVRLIQRTIQFSGQVETIINSPESAALIAAAPQAGRIFRPLCRMLGITPPPSIRLPSRPSRNRPLGKPTPPAPRAKSPRASRATPAPIFQHPLYPIGFRPPIIKNSTS